MSEERYTYKVIVSRVFVEDAGYAQNYGICVEGADLPFVVNDVSCYYSCALDISRKLARMQPGPEELESVIESLLP